MDAVRIIALSATFVAIASNIGVKYFIDFISLQISHKSSFNRSVIIDTKL